MLGLLGGAAWPARLFWLLWTAPLLLLVALQLLWHESTIFSGLKTGDWGRVICAALAGIIDRQPRRDHLSEQLAAASPSTCPLRCSRNSAMRCSGLLCLQLGDIIAEYWRGKQRSEL